MRSKLYKFVITVGNKKLYPKGFYYQGKYVVIVGCTVYNNTIRRKELLEDVKIEIFLDNKKMFENKLSK